MSQPDTAKQMPIGYWLKRVDELLTKKADQALSSRGFTRHRWQALNAIYEASTITRNDVLATMQTFIDADRLDEIIDGFLAEGWLAKQGEGDTAQLALTDAGKAEREAVFGLQGEVRRQAVQSISQKEYAAVIDVLRRMAANLE
ncbi:MAG: MarR family winged helix-turn-helix transcriptional regulator [Chloroflexia bacterium]